MRILAGNVKRILGMAAAAASRSAPC